MAELKVIGNAQNLDKQSKLVVTAKLDFSADRNFPGKLFTRILPSPYAHAKIKSIDTSQADAYPGVKATCTYNDCPIFSQTLTYWGQEVAAVAAVDPNTAARALELIKVEYEILPFVLNPDDSFKAGAASVGTWAEGNVTTETKQNRGDVDAGFAQANTIVEDTIGWSGYFHHNCLEPRSAVAYWVGEDVYIWTCSQNPSAHRSSVANVLKMPQSRIHLVSHGTGVAQGEKTTQEHAILAAVLAKKAGAPVETHLNRTEYMSMGRHQYPGKGTLKMGCKSDGTIVAIDATLYADVGGDTDPPSRTRAAGYHPETREQYICANNRNQNYDIATNKPKTGYYRSVGDPTGSFIMEIMIDQMAYKLNMDPVQFRLKNLITLANPHQDLNRPYSSVALKECLQWAADNIGWSSKFHAPGAKTLSDGRLHGIGIAVSNVAKGALAVSAASMMHLTKDGKVYNNAGIARAAGGTNSAVCHIIAEVLTLPYDDVMTGDWGNMDVCPEGGGQNGSMRTISYGAACQRGAEDMKTQIIAAGAAQLGIDVADADLKDGSVYSKSNPTKTKKISEIAAANSTVLVGRGYTWAKVLQRDIPGFKAGTACETKTMDACAVEIAVDTETGEIEVLSMTNADDCGKVIFRKGAEGQIEAGSEHILAQALFYEQIHDQATGAVLNPGFLDNKVTTFLDWDDTRCKNTLIESDDACGPFGCKGLGEPVLNAYVAFNNAFYNATGKWIKTAPITPAKVLQALGKA